MTGRNANRRGTLYLLVSKRTVWYLSTCPLDMTHASKLISGTGSAWLRSSAKRAATVAVLSPQQPLARCQATAAKMHIQLNEFLHQWHRRRPLSFEIVDPVLGARLLRRRRRHAELRREQVMRREGRVARVQGAFATAVDVNRHGGRVVPPQLIRDTIEEPERFDQPVQDCLGSFRWQRDRERRVRVRPGDDQDRHQAPAIGEVSVDVSEVSLGADARPMIEWYERLALIASALLQVAAHLVVATGVAVLGDQASMDLHRRMALLTRRREIGFKNRIDNRTKWSEHWGSSRF